MEDSDNLQMKNILKDLCPLIVSTYKLNEIFTAHDFINRFKRNCSEVYAYYLERYSEQFLNSRIAWVLSKYEDELGVVKTGIDDEENVSTWRRIN